MPTLAENVSQAVADFDAIRDAIEEKGVAVPQGTPTAGYAGKIAQIVSGGPAAPALGPWQKMNTPLQTGGAEAAWVSVAYGNGRFLAVSNAGTPFRVMTLLDGSDTWMPQNAYTPTGALMAAFNRVRYFGGRFLAVIAASGAYTSLDGLSWANASLPFVSSWNDLELVDGAIFAVATSGTAARIARSQDNGNTFEAYPASQAGLILDTPWSRIAYNPRENILIAVSSSNTTVTPVIISRDKGATWSALTGQLHAANWTALRYVDGLGFVAGNLNSSNYRAAWSPTGEVWNPITMPSEQVYDVASFGGMAHAAVAGSVRGEAQAISYESFAAGLTAWRGLLLPGPASAARGIAYGDNRLVAVCSTGAGRALQRKLI